MKLTSFAPGCQRQIKKSNVFAFNVFIITTLWLVWPFSCFNDDGTKFVPCIYYFFRLLQRQELDTLRTTSERLSSEVSELRKQLISEKYEKYVEVLLRSPLGVFCWYIRLDLCGVALCHWITALHYIAVVTPVYIIFFLREREARRKSAPVKSGKTGKCRALIIDLHYAVVVIV
jgi:hypothetical protein